MTTLSIIVPAYNAERRIESTLESTASFAADQSGDIEVIVVDDGSRDATSAVVATSSCPNLRVIRTERNMGKGHAVRGGMMDADGHHRLLTDADGSTPISQFAVSRADSNGSAALVSRSRPWRCPVPM